MPIIVDPDFTPPAPPTTVTSADGILTATLDEAHAGVLLRADYDGTTYDSDQFTTDITGWSAYSNGGTVATTVTWDSAGEPNLKAAWTGGSGSAGAMWTLPTTVPADHRAAVTFSIALTGGGAPTRTRVAFAPASGSSFAYVDLPVPAGTQTFTAEATVPAGLALARVYIYVTGPDVAAGSFLLDDVTVADAIPVKVRFERDSGRYRVRSGDAAWAPGGVAVAYDHEAPLGVASAWQAIPIFSDGTEGERSQTAALVLTAPANPSTAWIKPIAQPDLSVLAQVARTEEDGRPLNVSLAPIPGSTYPIGSWDVAGSLSLSRRLRTDTKDEYDALVAALTAGPVLVQSSPESGVPQDMYALATGTLAAVRMQGAETGFGWAYRAWDLQLTEIARPPTVDAPLRIPGNSCADLLATYTTCADLLAAVPTCGDLLTVA